jgi:hypothetical protein
MAHDEPVWRDRANFIIGGLVDGDPSFSEQIWARRRDENLFEVCCFPFLLYDLALGDKVAVDPDTFNIRHVVTRGGGWTFRAWFGSPEQTTNPHAVADAVVRLGGPYELSTSHNLLAVHAPSESIAQDIADYLFGLDQSGALEYETGKQSEER